MIFPARNLHFFQGFSMAMLNNQMVWIMFYNIPIMLDLSPLSITYIPMFDG